MSGPDHLHHLLNALLLVDVQLDILAVLRGLGEVVSHLAVQLWGDVLVLGGEVDGST